MKAARNRIFLILLVVLMSSSFAWAQDDEPEDTEGNTPDAEEAEDDEAEEEDEAEAPAEEDQAEEPQDLATADEAYDIKLRELEEKVHQLKEKIHRSKARLMLLREKVLHGILAGSKAVLTHQNDIGGSYKLESVAYYLDGDPIYGKIDVDGSLNKDDEIEIFNGTIQPGNHLLSVYMVYRGDSSVFTYVEGIQVKLKSSYTFKAEEGKIIKVSARGYDKGGVTAKFNERPAVEFDHAYQDLEESDTETQTEEE